MTHKTENFAALHQPGNPLILFNIWDAGSAVAVSKAGAKAIATGSWGVAGAHGLGAKEGQALFNRAPAGASRARTDWATAKNFRLRLLLQRWQRLWLSPISPSASIWKRATAPIRKQSEHRFNVR